MVSFEHRYSNYFAWIILALYVFLINPASSSYTGPSKGLKAIQPRCAPATFSYANKLYTYGGMTNRVDSSNIFSSITLSTENGSKGQIIYENIPQFTPGPVSSSSQAVVLQEKHTALLFTGVDYNWESYNETIRTYTYDLQSANASWNEIFPVSNIGPVMRRNFTATLAPNGKVYIYGGTDYKELYMYNDLWSFDPNTLVYTNLTLPNQTHRYGHTATALPNGQIVFIAGLYSDGLISASYYRNMDKIDIFDTNTNQWKQQNAKGISDEGRRYASAELGPDNSTIFFFGGINTTITYFNNIFLLNTTTWIWSIPRVSGAYPAGRSSFSMGFLDKNILAIFYGTGLNFGYTDINILHIGDHESPKYAWLNGPNDYLELSQTEKTPRKMNGGEIAGIAIGVLLFAIIFGFCVWKTLKDVNLLPSALQDLIWDPRSGEPMWTEISRMILQLILAFLFVAYVIFSIRQAIESPTTSITISKRVPSVQVPDIRFCIEDIAAPEYSFPTESEDVNDSLFCLTDTAYPCVDYITPLNMSVHLPKFEDSIGRINCYLFSPPDWFNLGETSDGYSNGTKLQFTFNGGVQGTFMIRMTQYPPGLDPNVKVYNVSTTNVPLIMSDQEVEEWVLSDSQGKGDPNTFTVFPYEALNIQYQIKDHQYLQDTGWNKVGFLSHYNHTPEITFSSTRSNFSMVNERYMTYNEDIFGSTTVYPMDYVSVVEQDQRIHTIINSLGSVGGIFSIILGIQVLLFGFRPKSPWGIVQRWSFGSTRYSLRRNLRNRFDTLGTPVPFASPVHDRFVTKNKKYDDQIDESETVLLENQRDEDFKDLQSRLCQMEKRAQLTERLLQAYYIDIEIFKELEIAIGQNKRKSSVTTLIEGNNSNDNTMVQRRVLGEDNV
ncbi:hypothetical protein CLU79DRAFT_757590 [Phycomyces nitens]|nr:hypothetical protein CLU79DRAFT_757590 [Phycomyces nitens]